MATTYTPLLELPKHDPTGPFDITKINEGFDLIDAGMAKAYRGKAAHDLLDNSDFPNAVNQREQASYTGAGITIDRWLTVGACTVTPSETGVVLEATGGMQWGQRLPLKLNAQYGNQPYTFAVCLSDGSIYVVTGTLPPEPTSYDGPQVAIGSTGFTMSVSNNNGYMFPRFFSSGGTVTLKWAALYIGIYTADTLPEYQPKNDVVELMQARTQLQPLMRGQRDEEYLATYIPGATYLKVQLQLNPPMRVAPSVYNAGNAMPRAVLYDSAGGVSLYPVTEIGVAASTTTSITLRLAVGSALPTDYRMATVDNMSNSHDIFASAEQ